METKQNKITTLILFILFGFFISYTTISLNNSQSLAENTNYYQNEEFFLPKISQPIPLLYSEITRNATRIYRLFESINFTINTFNFLPDVNYTKMQIDFSNGSIREFDMQYLGSNKFIGIYKPEYNAPVGFQNVSFLIYSETHELLNTHTTYTNFTIDTNYMVNLYNSEHLLTSEYYTEEVIDLQMIVYSILHRRYCSMLQNFS